MPCERGLVCVCVCVCVRVCACVCMCVLDGDVFQSFNASEGNLDLTSKSILSHSPVWIIAWLGVGVCVCVCVCVCVRFGCSGCWGCTESRISDLLLVVLPSAAFLWEAVLSECVREVFKG